MNNLFSYIKNNRFELLITFCIFTNLFPMQFPNFIYYVGLALISFKMYQSKLYFNKNALYYISLMIVMLLSSTINFALDFRIVLFFVLLILTSPIYTSFKWHQFKKKLLFNFFIGFVFVVIVSLYAKFIGYNYQAINVGTDYKELSETEFSGFARYPMWISAAAAICTVFIFNLFISCKKKTIRLFYFLFMLASIYINVISASRSALVASFIVIVLTIYFSSARIKTFLKYVSIILLSTVLLYPFFSENSDAMMRKQIGQEQSGKTSRDELWGQRMAEFKSSPLIGIGFAAHGVGDDKQVGRNESGGGWISILSQIGVIGFVLVVLIISKAITSKSKLLNDKYMMIVYMTFIFFCLHSIFEGYMFQGGWYLCLIFWLCTGVLIENKQYNINKQ